MRNKQNKHLGIEIDPELHYKLHYISKYEGRSANGQILYLIRKCVREFEERDGRSKSRRRRRKNFLSNGVLYRRGNAKAWKPRM